MAVINSLMQTLNCLFWLFVMGAVMAAFLRLALTGKPVGDWLKPLALRLLAFWLGLVLLRQVLSFVFVSLGGFLWLLLAGVILIAYVLYRRLTARPQPRDLRGAERTPGVPPVFH
jgi:hypothetical protein